VYVYIVHSHIVMDMCLAGLFPGGQAMDICHKMKSTESSVKGLFSQAGQTYCHNSHMYILFIVCTGLPLCFYTQKTCVRSCIALTHYLDILAISIDFTETCRDCLYYF
jgi:hypothetical protein